MDRAQQAAASNLMGKMLLFCLHRRLQHMEQDSPKAGSTCSKDANSLRLDTHNRLVADVLTRYRTLMMLATIQAEGERNNANPEAIAVTGISMKMEFDGLVSPSLLPLHISLGKGEQLS